MSFFKKLTAEFKELLNDKDDKPKEEKKPDKPAEHSEATRDYNTAPQQPYGSQPQQYPPQPYGQGQYGGGPGQHGGYNSPPPGPPGPPGQPQLPPGWLQQWDQNSQRWYYLEQATGRTQWEPPSHDRGFGYGQPPQQGYGAPAHHDGYGSTPSGQYGQPGHGYPGSPPPPGQYGAPQYHDQSYPPGSLEKEKKKSNTGKYMAAGAGGLAVGALAGAALSGDSSDEEHGATYAAQPNYYGGATGPMAPAPVPLEDNPELSSSQRSSLEEARKDYEEAQREVAEDSDPSSSDIEELQEAREEYHSEVEEAHEELEDD